MKFEVVKSPRFQDVWQVEAINHDGDGEVYVATFSGPDAKARADEYAQWKSPLTYRRPARPAPTPLKWVEYK